MFQFAKKCDSKTAQSELMILHFVSQTIGLTPINIKRLTFLCYLYPFFVTCIIVYGTIIGFRELSDLLYSLNSPVHLVTGNFTLLCIIIACWISNFCSVIRFKVYKRALKKLTKIEISLPLHYTDKTNHSTVVLYLYYSVLFSLIQILVDCFLLTSQGFHHVWSYLITFHVPLIFIILCDCRAKIIFDLLNIRFKRVNQYFLHAWKLDKTYVHKSIFMIPQQYLTKTKIKELSYVHCSLVKITRNFNSYFSPMLLLETAVFFTISTFNAFSFFYLLTDKHLIHYRHSLMFFSVYSTTVIFIKLNYLLKSAVQLMKEANTTSSIIHAILINGHYPSVQKELEILAQHLTHEKLEITVGGFFNLDYSLLHGMITASTTYLIIFIQFQISTDESPK